MTQRSQEIPTYSSKYRTLYEDGVLTEEQVEEQRGFYEKHKDDFAREHEKSTHIIELGDREFRAVLVRGESPETIVIGGEHGNANTVQAYTRAMGIRALLAPEASLVLLPNNTLGENNLHLSVEERDRLHRGNAKPYTDRFMKSLDVIGSTNDSLDVIGMSLGATSGAALAASRGDLDIASMTLIEPPHLTGSIPKIAMNFAASGKQLDENIAISKQGIGEFEAVDLDGILGYARFGAGCITPSNLAALSFMRARNTEKDIDRTRENHPGAAIVVAWGTEATISPAARNEALADRYNQDTLMNFIEIPGADHSVTNAHAVVAALAQHAKSLRVHQ